MKYRIPGRATTGLASHRLTGVRGLSGLRTAPDPAAARDADLRAQFRRVQQLNALLEQQVEERSRELVESELKLRTIVENAYDWERWDAPGGAVLYSSPSCERITGLPPEAFESDAGMLDRIIHPDDLERWRGHYAAYHGCPGPTEAPAGPATEGELRLLRPDGEVRWFEHSCHPIFDARGNYKGRRVKVRDLTERKQAEKERERAALLDKFNLTQQVIIACNQVIIRARDERELLQEFCRISMQVQDVHQAWVGLAGPGAGPMRLAASIGVAEHAWEQARLGGGEDLFGLAQADAALRAGDVQIQGGAPGSGSSIALPLRSDRHAFGALVLSSDKEDTFEETSVQMLLDLANNLSIGIIDLRTRAERDQALETSERQAEQLRSLALELAQTEQRERRHLAQVLHDHLQQLLVGATFTLETLGRQSLSVRGREALAKLAETVQEAIHVSRVVTVELSPPVVQEKGLAACLEWLGRHFEVNHGLEVALDLEGEVEPDLEPVRVFVFEAVRELLLNVVKHAKVDRAALRMRVLEGERIEITVEDHGEGFDLSALDTAALPSEGLGLFSLRQKLQFLKGGLDMASSPGRGSRFTMVVPVRGWPRKEGPALEGGPPPRAHARRTTP